MLSKVKHQTSGVRVLQRVVEDTYTSPLLLVGPEGTGKRLACLQVVHAMFCTAAEPSDACGCIGCVQLRHGIHPDLMVVTPHDDKDIGVDAIRELVVRAATYPSLANRSVFLIDGADRMTSAASNALLKVLEEPPPFARFFLLAEHAVRVIPTIRSRCGRVSFRTLPESFLLSLLEPFEKDSTKALVYVRMSEGSAGRALRYWGSGKIVLRDRVISMVRSALAGDMPNLFQTLDSMGNELALALHLLSLLLHDFIVAPYDTGRLVSVDQEDTVTTLSRKVDASTWLQMQESLRVILERYQSTKINVAYHVKALFAQHFCGV